MLWRTKFPMSPPDFLLHVAVIRRPPLLTQLGKIDADPRLLLTFVLLTLLHVVGLVIDFGLGLG